MSEFLTAVVVGLGSGSIYALVALGFVIIYKSMGVISFAQPAFLLSGAVLVSLLSPSIGFWGALAVGVVGIAVLALGVERVAIRPMVGKAVFVIAIITIGIDIVVRTVAGAFLGVNPRYVGDPWGLGSWTVGGVVIQHRHVAALATAAVVMLALFLFFRFTPIGLAMRAASLDQEAAMAQGVNVGTVFAVSWALAGGLAALAGVFAATGEPISNTLWIVALVALPVIILGGLDSLGGAVLGGFIIGIAQALVSTYHRDLFSGDVAFLPELTNNLGPVTPFIVMFLVLMVRPYGLFGTKEVERV
ncbi:branched-chain amino acid ABC transporter permease [Nocardioides sp. AE5]|uniref:branched-chain amino acid ABC transporter permease n=1 Tax=Nocardioides sp. AE5 TaxID=2962573 RepID=UPI002882B739|nr:branched-chain amino acid ABC transporter permease [Nocardioides sp. AE5]MDT0203855.1 branched-chain amino acid ABC transporter permease [Nocardioides sp. AE5]